MGEFVNGLNAAGDAFVTFGTRMAVQSSVLILALLVLDLILRRRVKAVVRYWIWLLVLVKLMLPPSLSSPASLAWWLGEALPEPPAQLADTREVPAPDAPPAAFTGTPVAIDSAGWREATTPTQASETAMAARTVSPVATLSWEALTLVAWFAVVLVMLALLAQRALFVRKLVLQSDEAPERLRDLLDRCRRQMHVRTAVGLRLTSISASPSVCGLVRPTILVPQRMLTHLDSGQLRSILLHELAHIRRADLWVNLAQTLLQIAYVYHPLVWLANAIIRRVREQAVDETVLAAMGDEAEEYPRTLLTVSKLAFHRPALSLRLVGVVESKKLLAARIRHITSRPFPNTARLSLLGLTTIGVTAIVLLPMARATPDNRSGPLGPRYAPVIVASDFPAPDGAGTTIAGIVINTDGKPITGAYVIIENPDLLQQPQMSAPPTQQALRFNSARTNSQGHFHLVDLVPGTTGISVRAPCYQTRLIPNITTGTQGLRIVLDRAVAADSQEAGTPSDPAAREDGEPSLPIRAMPGPMTEWSVSAGGNGHLYHVVHVPEGLTWDEAGRAAEHEGGYLATITSAEENAFVFSLIQDPIYWNGPRGPWIGGWQPRGRMMKAGWTWVTGESFEYSNWSVNQPNDSGAADETRLHYGWGLTTVADTWNDQPDWYRGVHAYVVETDPSGRTQVVTQMPVADTTRAENR